MMPLTHIVNRAFEGDGGLILQPKECVDATPWMWAQQLESQGRISPIPATIEPVGTSDGRFWASQQAADKHEQTLAKEHGDYPVKMARGRYLLSDGTVVEGSKATADAHENELQAVTKE